MVGVVVFIGDPLFEFSEVFWVLDIWLPIRAGLRRSHCPSERICWNNHLKSDRKE